MKQLLRCGTSVYDFDKKMADFKSKPTPNNKSTLYFIPWDELTDKAQKNMTARRTSEPDSDAADIVEDILGDISAGSLEGARGIPLDLDSQIQAANLEKTKVQTKALREKLERQRQEIWNGWSEEFFQCFTEAFAKVKNRLIELHLSEEQLKTLTDSIDLALESMQTKLDFMYNDFIENGLEKEDNLEDDLLK